VRIQNSRTGLAIMGMMMISLLIASSPVSAATNDSIERGCAGDSTYFLTGKSDADTTGSMSMFEEDLTNEESVTLDPVSINSFSGPNLVASWEMAVPATIHESDEITDSGEMVLHVRVSNADAIILNSSIVVEIGGDEFTSDSGGSGGAQRIAQGDSELTYTIEYNSNLSAGRGEDVLVSLYVTSAMFEFAGQSPKVEFIWGSSNVASNIELPLVLMRASIEEVRATATSALVHTELSSLLLDDIFAHDEYMRMEILANGGTVRSTSTVTEDLPGDSLAIVFTVPITIEAPQTFTVKYNPPGPVECILEGEFSVTETSGGGGLDYYYPEREPSTLGTSDLAIELQVTVIDDVIQHTTHLTFTGSMNLWVRWGIDNIADENLTSSSIWKEMGSEQLTSRERIRGDIEDAEIQAFISHMNQGQNLLNFLSGRMGLDSDVLLGASTRLDLDVLQTEVLVEDRAVRQELPFVLQITSKRPYGGASEVLYAQPLNSLGLDVWSSASFEGELSLGWADGVSAVAATDGVDHTRRRSVTTSSIMVSIPDLIAQGDLDSIHYTIGTFWTSPVVSVATVILGPVMIIGICFASGGLQTLPKAVLTSLLVAALNTGLHILAINILMMLFIGIVTAVGSVALFGRQKSEREKLLEYLGEI